MCNQKKKTKLGSSFWFPILFLNFEIPCFVAFHIFLSFFSGAEEYLFFQDSNKREGKYSRAFTSKKKLPGIFFSGFTKNLNFFYYEKKERKKKKKRKGKDQKSEIRRKKKKENFFVHM